MSEINTSLAEQFESLPQQAEASRLGMWAFLSSEIMFFGGLFLGYIVYRHAYPQAFAAGSRETDIFYGTLNTAILLTSSLTMALAVYSAQAGGFNRAKMFLLLTIGLAIAFLGVKGLEYAEDFRKHLFPGASFSAEGSPKTQLFFLFYWMMTGLHALHVLVGIGLLSTLAQFFLRRRFDAGKQNTMEVIGLYWHFVDIVWIFLYPLLYLVNRHA